MAGHSLEDGELLMAAMYGDIGKARRLISSRADIEVQGPNEATPLLLAARNGFTPVVRLLLKSGADVTARSENGATALLWAAYCGYASTVSVLLDAKSDVHVKAGDGKGALHAAIRGAQCLKGEGCAAAAVLLARGAEVAAFGSNTVQPIDQAKEDLRFLKCEEPSSPSVQCVEVYLHIRFTYPIRCVQSATRSGDSLPVDSLQDVIQLIDAHLKASVTPGRPIVRWSKSRHADADRCLQERTVAFILAKKAAEMHVFSALPTLVIEFLCQSLNYRLVLPPVAAEVTWWHHSAAAGS